MKRVLFIDFGDLEYFQQLAYVMSKHCEVIVVSKYSSSQTGALEFFYKFSSNIENVKLRKIVRGIEYIIGYIRTINFLKKNNVDIVHIQWSMLPYIDRIMWKRIKLYTNKLIYTAHDVIPHNYYENFVKKYKKLYAIPDRIIIHGDYCKNEVKKYFPEYLGKTYIQYHGVYMKKKNNVSENTINKHISFIKSIDNKKIIISLIGQINEYKGIDILTDAWEKFKNNNNLFLLIAGQTVDSYKKDFIGYKKKLESYENVYIYNNRFSEEEEELFYSYTDISILPYKSASMSGVLFTSAKHDKTVISTRVGCLNEYLNYTDNCITCEPNIMSIQKAIDDIIKDGNAKITYAEMGKKFSNDIYRNFSWDKIVNDLVDNCYK